MPRVSITAAGDSHKNYRNLRSWWAIGNHRSGPFLSIEAKHSTWSTESGGPSLAVTSETNDCNNFGHTDYLMGPDGEPVEQVEVDSTGSIQAPEYYYQVFQGNTRALLDQNGNEVYVYNYPAWGVASNWVGQSGVGTPLQYAGAVSESWDGLVYDQARWYDPSTAQFLSQDPLVEQTLQPYSYAGGTWPATPLAQSFKAGAMSRNAAKISS